MSNVIHKKFVPVSRIVEIIFVSDINPLSDKKILYAEEKSTTGTNLPGENFDQYCLRMAYHECSLPPRFPMPAVIVDAKLCPHYVVILDQHEKPIRFIPEPKRSRAGIDYGSWTELFPEGRYIYYEGDEPVEFILEMNQKFGLDMQKLSPEWHADYLEFGSFGFFCPPEHLDAIYGNDIYPMGS